MCIFRARLVTVVDEPQEQVHLGVWSRAEGQAKSRTRYRKQYDYREDNRHPPSGPPRSSPGPKDQFRCRKHQHEIQQLFLIDK